MTEPDIPWWKLVKGKRYRIAFRDNPNQLGTFRQVLWSNPQMAEVLFDTPASWAGLSKRSVPLRLTVYRDNTNNVKFYPTFGEKLALLNTKLKADPGVLSEIMKFQKSNFKPGPWTEMTKAQAAVSAATARKETETQEQEALAAMKTGGTTRRRRRRRSTKRRRV